MMFRACAPHPRLSQSPPRSPTSAGQPSPKTGSTSGSSLRRGSSLATVVVEGGERKVTNPLFQFADLIQTTQNRNKYPSLNVHSLQHVRTCARCTFAHTNRLSAPACRVWRNLSSAGLDPSAEDGTNVQFSLRCSEGRPF